MKIKSLFVAMALVSTAANAAPSNLEDVIYQARKDGATIIECVNNLCFDRFTHGPVNPSYAGSPDGVYIEYKDPVEDSYKLLDEAARIVQETKADQNGY